MKNTQKKMKSSVIDFFFFFYLGALINILHSNDTILFRHFLYENFCEALQIQQTFFLVKELQILNYWPIKTEYLILWWLREKKTVSQIKRRNFKIFP